MGYPAWRPDERLVSVNHPAAQHDKLQCARKHKGVIMIIQTYVLFILLHLVQLTNSDNSFKSFWGALVLVWATDTPVLEVC